VANGQDRQQRNLFDAEDGGQAPRQRPRVRAAAPPVEAEPVANGEDAAAPGNTYAPSPDAADIDELWIKTGQGDPLTAPTLSQVPVGRPKDFFRTVPNLAYRERTEIYVHKTENDIGETAYIIGPALREQIQEAHPCLLVTVVDRAGNPRLWPLKLPKEDGKDNAAWATARAAAKTGLTQWVRIVWINTSTGFQERPAELGYAPDPDFGKLQPFANLVRAGFGKHGIIRDKTHPIYRDLFGLAEPAPNGDDPLL
jgi:hypothetical protein